MQVSTLYTIGHSNRPLDEVVSMLKQAGVTVLVDVRADPRSRHNPQFNEDCLREAVTRAEIAYHWAGRQLGGLRAGQPNSPHTALDEGLRGFADYMDTEPFQKGAAQLMHMAVRSHTAILCAERDPHHCHRWLISDYLLLQGFTIVHLIRPGETREHVLSPEARRESAALVYDRQMSGTLPLE